MSNQDDPRQLIPELCRHFYTLGWASGTGGGLSICQDNRIYCAPSGVQKERIQAEDIFVLDKITGQFLERPTDTSLKCSECLSLFMVPFRLRDAGCCIHSHSIYANLLTSLSNSSSSESDGNTFLISKQEMIKGIAKGSSGLMHRYSDTLEVPIIENTEHERDLEASLRQAVEEYPNTNAVLVKNHGVYVWGKDWRKAKSMAECYDYLFRLRLEAVKCGLESVA